jgi:hypothetical protein
MASESVDDLCKRYFYPIDATLKWDWPNFQYTYPWKVYFDKHGLIVLQTLNSGGTVIPNTSVILYPPNEGPPYRWLELRRDKSDSFGHGSTPQLEIQITGTWGWWLNQTATGILSQAINSSVSAIQVTTGNIAGVGDTLFIDSERFLVTDMNYITTGQTQQQSGCSSASPADNQLLVTDSSQFVVGDVLLLDAELMLVLAINGQTLIVKRAWSGSVLGTHSGATILANRLLSVARGQLGTAAASHLQNAGITVLNIPPLVNELAIAYSLVGITQEPSAYSAGDDVREGRSTRTGGQVSEDPPGVGIAGLETRVRQFYGRVARTRVV